MDKIWMLLIVVCLVFIPAVGLAQHSTEESQDTELDGKFLVAVTYGDVETVREALQQGANINVKPDWGEPALLTAAFEEHLEIVNILLEHGADVNISNREGRTALMVASFKGHIESIELLLKHGAAINAQTETGRTALMEATGQRHIDVLEILLKNGADPNAEGNGGTALSWAVCEGNFDAIAVLSKHGTKLKLRDIWVMTNMHGLLAAFRLLTVAFVPTARNIIVLVCAIISAALIFSFTRWKIGQTQMVRQPSRVIHYIARILYYATSGKCLVLYCVLAAVWVYMKKNVSPQEGLNQPFSGIGVVEAARRGDLQTVTHMVEKQKFRPGEILQFVAYDNSFSYIEESTGITALMYASMNGHTDVVKFLLKYGANPEKNDHRGRTALMLAAQNGHTEIVKLLLKDEQADMFKKHEAILSLKNESMTFFDQEYPARKNALLLAVEGGYTEIVDVFFEHLKQTGMYDLYMNTEYLAQAFFVAVHGGHREIVELLLEHNIDVNIKTKQNLTALKLAESRGHTEIIRLLNEAGAK